MTFSFRNDGKSRKLKKQGSGPSGWSLTFYVTLGKSLQKLKEGWSGERKGRKGGREGRRKEGEENENKP